MGYITAKGEVPCEIYRGVTLGERMVSRVESVWVPMIVTPPKAVAISKEAGPDSSPKRQKDFIVLENRREIKSHTHYERGIFLDVYV